MKSVRTLQRNKLQRIIQNSYCVIIKTIKKKVFCQILPSVLHHVLFIIRKARYIQTKKNYNYSCCFLQLGLP